MARQQAERFVERHDLDSRSCIRRPVRARFAGQRSRLRAASADRVVVAALDRAIRLFLARP